LLVVRASSLVSLVLALGFAGVSTPPARAGWSSGPVSVRPTTASIPAVAACNDGGLGTFVVWQEEATSGSGELRVNHLLPTGDFDLSWPSDGVVGCDFVAGRPEVGVLPDHLGGCYVWWTEVTAGSPSLFVTHLISDGTIATGWPTRGLLLGTVGMTARPSAIEDAAHGLYLAWSQNTVVRAHHLGPNGLGAGGWPNSPRVVVPIDPAATFHLWPDLALAPDGGIFLSWGTWSLDTTIVESGMYLRRLTTAGLNAPGWPIPSQYVGPLRPGEQIIPKAALLDISPDDRGGLFMIVGNIVAGTCCEAWAEVRLYRLLADGQTALDWPSEGRSVAIDYWYAGYSDGGLRVYPDGRDGAIAERREFYSDSPALTGLHRFTADGLETFLMQGVSAGREVVVKGDGGAFMADFKPVGPTSPWDWSAFIQVDQSLAPPGWTRLIESHDEPMQQWFGDIALASTGDGGAVFFWSQYIDRFGLFARRFGPAGEVTGVAPTTASLALHGLRFLSGAGVLARVGLLGGPARLDLFDTSGRRLASRSIDGAGIVEVALPGTAGLPSGVYFGRLVSRAGVASGKVAITR